MKPCCCVVVRWTHHETKGVVTKMRVLVTVDVIEQGGAEIDSGAAGYLFGNGSSNTHPEPAGHTQSRAKPKQSDDVTRKRSL